MGAPTEQHPFLPSDGAKVPAASRLDQQHDQSLNYPTLPARRLLEPVTELALARGSQQPLEPSISAPRSQVKTHLVPPLAREKSRLAFASLDDGTAGPVPHLRPELGDVVDAPLVQAFIVGCIARRGGQPVGSAGGWEDARSSSA